MINKPFDRVDLSDLLALVERKVAEHRTLEFKRDLPRTKDQLVELLRDLTALANGQGGDLLIGIGEKKGVADAIAGAEIENTDAKRQEFENALRDRTEPRLTNFQLSFVPVSEGRYVVHFRVRPSLAAPHAVRNETHRNYFARNSVGKYEMDVSELRDAFSANEKVFPRLRSLHAAAIARSKGHHMPFRLSDAPRCVLSLIPRSFLHDRMDLPITRENALVPFRTRGYDFIPSLEGLLAHSKLKDGKSDNFETLVDSYVLNHWEGYFDIGWTIGTPPQTAIDRLEEKRPWRSEHFGVVSPEAFEQGVLGMTNSGIAKLRELGREGPWIVMVTVKGLGNTRLALGPDARSLGASRNSASLGELTIEDATPGALMPFARAIWLLFAEQRPVGRPFGAR